MDVRGNRYGHSSTYPYFYKDKPNDYSVVFKWTKPSGADHYTIVVQKGSTTVKTVKNVTGTSKKISGLSKNTSYSSHIYPYKKNGTQIAGGYCTFKTKKN